MNGNKSRLLRKLAKKAIKDGMIIKEQYKAYIKLLKKRYYNHGKRITTLRPI